VKQKVFYSWPTFRQYSAPCLHHYQVETTCDKSKWMVPVTRRGTLKSKAFERHELIRFWIQASCRAIGRKRNVDNKTQTNLMQATRIAASLYIYILVVWNQIWLNLGRQR